MDPNEIATCCLQQLNKLKFNQSGFTVIAGMVLKSGTELKCIALGTGTKALPSSFKNHLLVLDSHAEIICRRNWKRFMLHELLLKSGICCVDDDGFVVRENIEFYLYISQAPCGDASMKQLDLDQTWEQRISNETKKRKFHSIDSDIKDKNRDIHDRSFLHGVVRGRNEYHALGQLRTKPGRIDSEPSLAMSCSDKIAKWNRLGLNGALLSLFLPPIRLAGIIIGDYYDYDELHRSLNTRVGTAVPIFHTTIRFPLSKSNCQGKPIPCSLSWNCHDKSQIIVNGKKQGAKEINSKTSPLISKYHLAKLFMSVYGEHHISYSNIKKQATHYQQEKKVLYSSRNFCDWICASPESFFIDE